MSNYLWKTEQEFGHMQTETLLAVEDIYWFGKKMMENGKYYGIPGFLIKRNNADLLG